MIMLADVAATGDVMSGVSVPQVLIGVVLPPLIAIVNRVRWAPQLKAVTALAVCLVTALLVRVLQGPVDFADWRNTALVVTVSALASYRLLWSPSGIAPTIESTINAGPLAVAGPADSGGGHRRP